MTQAMKFTFDDFGGRESGSARRAADAQALLEAEQLGLARGRAEGRWAAEQDAAMRLAIAMETLARASSGTLAQFDAEISRLEREAAALALAFARKLAGDVIARDPLAQLALAAADCFRHLQGVPHVAVRVPADLIDAANAVLDRAAAERGFAGRLIVLGEPDMAAGDFRLEWADGGVARSGAEIDALIAAAIARHCGASPDDVLQ